jgi:hypothetical protein
MQKEPDIDAGTAGIGLYNVVGRAGTIETADTGKGPS